jgi:hypothetical protein
MPRRFKNVEELVRAVDVEEAQGLARDLVARIETLAFQPPASWIPILREIAETMDGIANSLAIEVEAKRVAQELEVSVKEWLSSQREVTLKPLGKSSADPKLDGLAQLLWEGRILISVRDEKGNQGEFVTPATDLLPNLSLALLGEVPSEH